MFINLIIHHDLMIRNFDKYDPFSSYYKHYLL